jgi:TusA-related sulfurtransferase
VRIVALIGAVTLLAASACDEKKPTPPATPSASAPATTTAPVNASASAPAPSASAAPTASAGAEDKTAKNCPSAVGGAATTLKDVEGGVELTVVAKDAAATGEIRSRAKSLLEASKAPHEGTKHDGKGGGHGVFGRCPVVLHDTTLAVADTEGGTKITVKAKDKKDVDALRKATKERNDELAAPGAEGAGHGKMGHCPSAVVGAETKVADAKDGVVVTVTGKGDAVATIRERAKHLVTAAKQDPTTVKHTGEGGGGGGLGRCPVVLKDTTVETKDVEGGSQITVKPTKPADLANLQKEAKERAAMLKTPGK